MTERLNEELETRRKTTDKLTHERHQNQKEKEHTQEVRGHEVTPVRRQLYVRLTLNARKMWRAILSVV